MKLKLLAFLALVSGLLGGVSPASAQGTAFTCQGSLTDNGAPASGNYNLTFSLFTAGSGGSQVGVTLTNKAVGVTNGLFTTMLDFGSGVFEGGALWVQIGVRTNGNGAFGALNPANTRTPASGVPVVTSGFLAGATVTSGGSGYTTPPTVTVNDATGSGATVVAVVSGGSVAGLEVQTAGKNYSAGATLTIGAPPSNASQTFLGTNFFTGVNTLDNPANSFVGSFAGNSGASPANGNFVGTTDNQPLALRVNGARALRLEPSTNGAPNVIGGSLVNLVDARLS